MEFSVNAKALTGLVDMLDRRGQDINRVAAYVNAHSALQWGPGLLNNSFRYAHVTVSREVVALLQRVRDNYLYPYAAAVDGAIYDYTNTDQAANVRFDATLPGSNGQAPRSAQPADQALGPDIFADPAKFVLKPPRDFSAEHPYNPPWYDTFSPSSWGRDGLWKITSLATTLGVLDHPIDAAQAFTLPLCGDWPGLMRYAYALRQTGQACSYVGDRVTAGATTLNRVWTGQAADNCAAALGGFALDLKDAQPTLDRLADSYEELAEAARTKAEGLVGLVTTVGDLVGSFGTAMIFEAPEIIAKVPKMARTIEDISVVIEGLHMTAEGAASLGHFRAHDLSQILPSSVGAKTSAGMPVLPTPAHHR
jgi:hypothetical protein